MSNCLFLSYISLSHDTNDGYTHIALIHVQSLLPCTCSIKSMTSPAWCHIHTCTRLSCFGACSAEKWEWPGDEAMHDVAVLSLLTVLIHAALQVAPQKSQMLKTTGSRNAISHTNPHQYMNWHRFFFYYSSHQSVILCIQSFNNSSFCFALILFMTLCVPKTQGFKHSK